MLNVSSWSIRNPIPAVMLFVLLTFAGLMSFNAMKVQNFPDIDLPSVRVTAALPGAAPGQLETDVAVPVGQEEVGDTGKVHTIEAEQKQRDHESRVDRHPSPAGAKTPERGTQDHPAGPSVGHCPQEQGPG